MEDVKTVVIGILLGCKHTYWGDISKAIVELLRKVWCKKGYIYRKARNIKKRNIAK